MDAVAQRYPSHEGRTLVDYLSVLLPCQILAVDTLVIERRELPSPVEFVLKACKAGLVRSSEISAFLGFTPEFTGALIDQMKDDELVGLGIDGHLSLLRRGKEALLRSGDCVHIDKTITVLWDAITDAPILSRQELLSFRGKNTHDLKARFPAILRTPDLNQLDVKSIQSFRRAARDIDAIEDRENILKFLGIKRALHKYRRASLLIYENGRSTPVVKLAIDGQIDEQLSSAFALKDGATYLGLDQRFNRRAGALAVDSRLKELNIESISGRTHEVLTQRRSVLTWSISTINARLAEDDAPAHVREQLAKHIQELKEVEAELGAIPVRYIDAAEFILCVEEALVNATRNILITTTMPSAERFTTEIERALVDALRRGVRISIYIADRIDASKSGHASPRSPVARLNRLASNNSGLMAVRFLQNTSRPVFEISWDDSNLVFANDSPFGLRPDPTVPRAFRGVRVSETIAATKYVQKHLSLAESDFVKKVVSTRPPKKHRPEAAKKGGAKSRVSGKPISK